MHCGGLTAQFFRRFDVRITDNEIRQCIHLALNNRDIAAGKLGIDDGRSDRTGVSEVASKKALNSTHAAVDKDGLKVEAMLFKNAGLFSDPVNDRRVAGIGYVCDIAFRVS